MSVTLSPKRILVVEDDESVQALTCAVLDDEGYEVAAASNGEIALKKLAQTQPDLILLDLWMPILDGRAFLERYHQLPGHHAPVIVFTASMINKRTPVFTSEVVDFLPKPFDLDEMLTMVERALDKHYHRHVS